MKKFGLFIALICTPSLYATEEYPGQNLLNYFSSSCKTQGEWTRAAIADSIALVETLRSISKDEACKSVGGSIAQLGLLSQQLTSLENTNETQKKIAELTAKEQELLVQISLNPDPDTLATMNAELRAIQLERAGLIGRESAHADLATQDKASAMTSIVKTAETTFAQLANNQQCLEQHPNALNIATSLMSSIGATAAVVNPALGLGLMAGSQIMGTTIEGVRGHLNERNIRRLADNTLTTEAFKCALESMTEKFCQMRDAEAFLNFKDRYHQTNDMDPELGSAIRLNSRELPVLIDWLNKIKSGVTPTTTADAQRQNAVFARETFVRQKEASGLGLIEETRFVFDSATTQDEKRAVVRSLVKSLLPWGDGHVKNPFFEIITEGYSPFYLLGLADDATIRQPGMDGEAGKGPYYDLDSWPGFANYNPNLDHIKVQYQSWIEKARNRVNQELTQVLQPDALQTLTSAYDRFGNRWKISPMDSLKRLITFIEKHPPTERNPAFRKLYQSTTLKLKRMYEITEDAIIRSERDYHDNNNSSVIEIYEEAQLQYGTVVMEARLDMIIRLSLLELLENSDEEDQILVAQLLAAERFTETISKVKGTDNIALIRADIRRGREITMNNLNGFLKTFYKPIGTILFRLQQDELNSTGTVARSKRYSRTEMCFLLLGVPEVDTYVRTTYCSGLQMISTLQGGPQTFVIDQSVFDRDISDRACEYRDFFRKSDIYRDLNRN